MLRTQPTAASLEADPDARCSMSLTTDKNGGGTKPLRGIGAFGWRRVPPLALHIL
jgi:hypothetical protein